MMKKMKMTAASAAAIAIATGLGGAAFAQETTGAIRGAVVDPSGAPVSGATVTVTDNRTGAVRTLTTGANGDFSARGLPVSGDYSVRVVTDQYVNEQVDGVSISIGNTTNLAFDLEAGSGASDEIVVVATRSVVSEVATGPSAVFSAADLNDLPNMNRDIKDIIRLDPRINVDETTNNGNGVFCAGGNSRSNSLTVDGIKQNDDFGLNSNGYPTQRMPFPYDAVEQVSVELAPFDVEYGGFTGCNINVVTKSGSNEFHGGMFLTYDFALLNGNSLDEGAISVSRPANDTKTWGGVLSGPIIKDRVFFTFAYEKYAGADTVDIGYPGSGATNIVPGVTEAEVNRVIDIMRNVYNYDPLEYFTSAPTEDRRYFAKIDAYITENHRLELAYQNTQGNSLRTWDLSTSFRDFSLPSHWYNRAEILKAYSARLFSDWTENFSTELKVSYQDRETLQEGLGGNDFAWFEIDSAGGADIHVGPDPNRHANQLTQDVINVKFKAQYQTGAHLFTAGYELDHYEFYNVYAYNSEGFARFSSIDALEAMTPNRIEYQNAPSNNKVDAGADVSRMVHTFYVQDDWDLMPNVNVVLGLRYDLHSSWTDITYNPLVEARYGVRNDATLNGLGIIQPRLAFDWQALDRLKVTGGVGRFSGGDPTVWVSNNYSNTGMNIGSVRSDNGGLNAGFNGYDIPQFIQDQNTASALAGTGDVSLLDPDFKIPSIWRFSLGAQYDADLSFIGLGDGWLFGADALYTIGSNPYNFLAISQEPIGVAPDGRPIYDDTYGQEVYMLTNGDESPKSLVLSTYFDKTFDITENKSVHMNFGYAYTDAEEAHAGTSSTAWSSFEGIARVDVNSAEVARSNYSNKHSIRGRLDLEHRWSDDVRTRVSFVGLVNSGRPYSLTLDTNNGTDGQQGGKNLYGDYDVSINRTLPYIPLVNDPIVAFASPTVEADFNHMLAVTGLDKYRGGFAPRNEFFDEWWGQLDLRFEQTFPGVMDGHSLVFFTNIDNLTNLLNDKWGIARSQVSGSYRFKDVVAMELSGDQLLVTEVDLANALSENIDTGLSVWSVQFGLRYNF